MAADDPYAALGVARDATEAQIRSAYRKLAKQHHPDLNPGDKAAEERFKAVSAANELLSDADKRARFDRGEIDASGQEVRPERAYYRQHGEARQGAKYRNAGAGAGNPFGDGDMGDIFGDLFRQARAEGGDVRRRGQDRQFRLPVSFLDAVNGATTRLSLPEGGTLDVRIPPGIEDGQTLRLRGKGGPGFNGGPAGDALIEIEVVPHPHFQRDGADLLLEVPVTYAEAVLGAKITVPTPRGPVAVTVPPLSDSGTRLRLRGRGVAARGETPAGDLFIVLQLVLGKPDPALAAFLREHPGSSDDPRAKIMESP
jgi:DnaJ-class molecular chaperone